MGRKFTSKGMESQFFHNIKLNQKKRRGLNYISSGRLFFFGWDIIWYIKK